MAPTGNVPQYGNVCFSLRMTQPNNFDTPVPSLNVPEVAAPEASSPESSSPQTASAPAIKAAAPPPKETAPKPVAAAAAEATEAPSESSSDSSFGDILSQFEQSHQSRGETVEGTVVSVTP